MELEDLKSTWKSVMPHVEEMAQRNGYEQSFIGRRMDVKTKLVVMMYLAAFLTVVFFALMATSRLWCPLAFPLPWLVSFCVVIFGGGAYEACFAWKISRIDLAKYTNAEILNSVAYIKKAYKGMEITATVLMSVLLIWLMSIPPFVNTWRMFFTGGLLLFAVILEFAWYRKFTRDLNKLGIPEEDWQ